MKSSNYLSLPYNKSTFLLTIIFFASIQSNYAKQGIVSTNPLKKAEISTIVSCVIDKKPGITASIVFDEAPAKPSMAVDIAKGADVGCKASICVPYKIIKTKSAN